MACSVKRCVKEKDSTNVVAFFFLKKRNESSELQNGVDLVNFELTCLFEL